MHVIVVFMWSLMLLFGAAAPSSAETRVALVIGNGAYKNIGALGNPPNDASDMASSLEHLGFSVTKVIDGNFDGMRRAIIDFGRRARGADMVVVFYAGHGMEVGGENWLLPVDAELKSDTTMEQEAVSLKGVMLQVEGASKLGLVILDACRNNPFAASMQRSAANRAVSRGLGRIEPSGNVLVAYSAKDGTTAQDGSGRNSPFTTALLKYLQTPDLEITFLFRHVRDEVMNATNQQQQPFVYGSLSKQAIYLKRNGDSLAVGQITTVPDLAPGGSSPPLIAPTAGGGTVTALTQDQERALKLKDKFKECEHCPEMVVIPAGHFMMGCKPNQINCKPDAQPQHQVTFAKPFAVGRFAVSWDEWDACVTAGACKEPSFKSQSIPLIGGSYRSVLQGQTPTTAISWNDAVAYVKWLSQKTGKTYRLLTEAEYEYAIEASLTKARPKLDAFNPWGLFIYADNITIGNVWVYHDLTWTEDCWNENYSTAPSDGSAQISPECTFKVVRGYDQYNPNIPFSYVRSKSFPSEEKYGLRVARTLTYADVRQAEAPVTTETKPTNQTASRSGTSAASAASPDKKIPSRMQSASISITSSAPECRKVEIDSYKTILDYPLDAIRSQQKKMPGPQVAENMCAIMNRVKNITSLLYNTFETIPAACVKGEKQSKLDGLHKMIQDVSNKIKADNCGP